MFKLLQKKKTWTTKKITTELTVHCLRFFFQYYYYYFEYPFSYCKWLFTCIVQHFFPFFLNRVCFDFSIFFLHQIQNTNTRTTIKLLLRLFPRATYSTNVILFTYTHQIKLKRNSSFFIYFFFAFRFVLFRFSFYY